MKIAFICFTDKAREIAKKLEKEGINQHEIKVYFNPEVPGGVKKNMSFIWKDYDALVFIAATGIAVRMISPLLEDKTKDPAVIVIDDLGRFTISLLSGHLGGANRLADHISKLIGSTPIITTATDGRGIESIDLFSIKNDYYIEDMASVTKITAMMVNGKKIGIYTEDDKIIDYENIMIIKDLNKIHQSIEAAIIISSQDKIQDIKIPYTLLRPKNINIAVGCRKGISGSHMIKAISTKLEELNLSEKSIKSLGTVELKKDEKGILDTAKYFKLPLKIFSIEEIRQIEDKFTKSEFVKKSIGVYSVAEPVAYLLGGQIISGKSKHDGMTISISKEVKND